MENRSIAASEPKIIEFEDNDDISDDGGSVSENEDDEIPIMFKKSVLKNKRWNGE